MRAIDRTTGSGAALAGALLLAAAATGPGAVRAQDGAQAAPDRRGPAPRATALVGGRVIPIGAPELEDGVVLVVDGRVAAVGPRGKVDVPYDARVLDVKGKVVFPGLVLAHTAEGLDRPNEGLPVAPFLDVRDAIDPSSLFFEDALRDGVTTVHVIHGDDTLIGGVGRVVWPMGLTVDEMTQRPATALKLSVGGKAGWDRPRQRAQLREAFAQLADAVDVAAEKRFLDEEEKAGRPITATPEEARQKGRALLRDDHVDDKWRALWRLTQGRLDAFVYCAEARDVDFALALALEHGFLERTTFVLGGECWKALDLLREAGRPVVLPPDLVWLEPDAATGRPREVYVAKAVADAGLRFSLQTDARSSFGQRFLTWQAAVCVRQGVARERALEAITLAPAQACGLGERKGSIAVGKDGDLLVLSGDPLAATTVVEQVLLGGRVCYERARDFRLRKLVTGDEKPGDQKPGDPKPGDPKPAGEAPAGEAPAGEAPGRRAPGAGR